MNAQLTNYVGTLLASGETAKPNQICVNTVRTLVLLAGWSLN